MGPQERLFYEEVSELEDHIDDQVEADGLHCVATSYLADLPLHGNISQIVFRIEVRDKKNRRHKPAVAEWDMAEGAKSHAREDLFRQARKEVKRQWALDEFTDLPHIDSVIWDCETELVPTDDNGVPLEDS